MNRSSNQFSKISSVNSKIIREKKIYTDVCLVCGDVAQYSYYGSVVCQSCKMFFKRNAQNKPVSISNVFFIEIFEFL